jgi:aconitate hydratase
LVSTLSSLDITVEIKHHDGKTEQFLTTTSINEGQWEWFKHGSALNLMAKKAAERAAA